MKDIALNEPKFIEYIDSEQSANTLFKFMKKIDYLKEILENCAIIPRYYDEIIDYLKITLFEKIAFPMSCFCDINLTKLNLHSKTYGKFGIGIKKEWAYRNIDIEPIHYVNPYSNEIKDFRKAFLNALKNTDENSKEISNYLSTSLLYMKPIFGLMENEEGIKNYCFHDEREWRYIPSIKEENITPILTGKMLTETYKNISNKAIKSNKKYWLKFSPEDINYLIVGNEEQGLELANYINILKDKYTESQRLSMISKILILDNLGKDW